MRNNAWVLAKFADTPEGVAVDAAGNLYTALFHTGQIASQQKRFLTSPKPLLFALFVVLWCLGTTTPQTNAGDEMKSLSSRLLAPPKITVEAGFSAKVLIPPGQLYDPLYMIPCGNVVWLNDDGGEEQETGSRLLAIHAKGKLSILAGVGKLLPVIGFDIAPASFGPFASQIFSLAQGKVAMEGATANHVIQRIDPQKDFAASLFCTLPTAGTVNQGISGLGIDARFGPEGSPFAGKFFAITAFNNTIYQALPDGTCAPFVIFDEKRFGTPGNFAFSADGKAMLVTVAQGNLIGAPTSKAGAIVEVSAEGKVADKPLVTGLTNPGGLAIAPQAFGPYAGQLFVVDAEDFQAPVPMTQALKPDGKVYRVVDGVLHLVASGFINPAGVRFLDNKVWISDVNGDFVGGKRELPDGFLVEIRVR